MSLTISSKTLSMFGLSALNEMRSSIRKGLEFNLVKTIDKYGTLYLNPIINDTYTFNNGEEMTILIETILCGYIRIIKCMLANFDFNLNAKGKVKYFGSIVDGATALWCAAVKGRIDIVKVLVERGATVDCCTKTKSTPLRAACYVGWLDVVKYLVEHGANVNMTNIFNSTCLTKASQNGHNDVVEYLLENGADVDKQTYCGATALHYAAQANNMSTVLILLRFNAKHLKNEHSLTPILVAAEKTHYGLVKYLLDTLNLTQEERIETEELLGASYISDRNSYDMNLGFTLLLHSMEMRFNTDSVIHKRVYKQVEAYDNRVECQTVQDLMDIKNNSEALHYESLIIRERILGDKNPDLLPSIIYRGSVYANSKKYTSCLKLWLHAMKLAQKTQSSIYKDLRRFSEVFCLMVIAKTKVNLSTLKTVLESAIEELKRNKHKLLTISADEKKSVEAEYFGNISSILGLITITSISLTQNDNSEDVLKDDLLRTIAEINKHNIKTKEGKTLLHLSLDYETKVDKLVTYGYCWFPHYPTMKLLIDCGADVDAVDINRNTPLHLLDKFITYFQKRKTETESIRGQSYFTSMRSLIFSQLSVDYGRDMPHSRDDLTYIKSMVMELLNSGAHTDFVNNDGVCPHTGFLSTVFNITNKNPLSLQCLSARSLAKLPKSYYHLKIPKKLEEFTNSH